VTDTITQQHRSENMRRITSKNTSTEMTVRRLVHGMGFRYRLHVADLPGKPDIVLQRLQKIIEVRGCFWHQHGKCIDSHVPKTRTGYWVPKLQRNRKRDATNMRKLRKAGFQVLILWECQVADEKRLKAELERFLKDE
jgi:DNA mismatch endonuclease, patch repair protein